MNTFEIFLKEFWFNFIIITPVYAALALGRRVSLDGNSISVTANSFGELSAFPKEEQKRLLNRADKKAFHGWRVFLPGLLDAAILAGSLAIARTVHEVTSLPYFSWRTLGFVL